MFGEQFSRRVQEKRLHFMIFAACMLVFMAGVSFTFVIPGFKGFDGYFLFLSAYTYFVVASIFSALFDQQIFRIVTMSLLLSSLGMGLRMWLEWGEVSLAEHMDMFVLMGYPLAITFFIVCVYSLLIFNKTRKRNP